MALLPEVPAVVALTRYLKPPGTAYGGPGMCRAGGCGSTMGRQVMKSYPFVAIVMGKRISTEHSWVYFFYVGGPSSSLRSGRTIYGKG
jgi:hypothetical protein